MKTIQYFKVSLIALAAVAINGCQSEAIDNGLSNDNFSATFEVKPVAGSANRFVLNATTPNLLGSKWNLGDGSGTYLGQMQEPIFLPDAGTYVVEHTAIGKGGSQKTATQTINVATSDVNSGNLVQGGKFLNAADHAKWTVLNIAGNSTRWTFGAGFARINGTSGGWDQQGIFQAVNVIGGKRYKIDMNVAGSAAVNTWFEVYIGTAVPVQNTDYTSLGRRVGLSTWDGCATSTYDGKLSTLRCVGSGEIVTFPTSQTVYFLIKSGGNNLGATGITIRNVEFRGI